MHFKLIIWKEMCTKSPENGDKCGLVFLSNNKEVEFEIRCFSCLREFKKWTHFTSHIRSTYMECSRNYHKEKNNHMYTNESILKYAIENEKKCKNSTYHPEATELELRTESDDPGNLRLEGSNYLKESFHSSDCHIMPKYTVQHSSLDEEALVKLEVEILTPLLEEGEEMYSPQDQIETNATIDNTEKRVSQIVETIRPGTRCFFQLRTTDPSIILGFIDIVRHNPCQWNPQHCDFDHKDRRDESAKKICRELKNHFNICISPKLARSSILSLIRWFEREYLRSLQLTKTKIITKRGRWSRAGYVCAHPAYFNKLLEFIPYNHLQLASCDNCERVFKTQNQLLVHNHQAHGGDAPFTCRHCKRSFLHYSTLRHHENRHTKNRVWNCPSCRHISTTKTDYNLHMVTHTDIRAYVCDLCGESYKSSTSVNVHLRTHKPPRLQCNICSKKFYENYRFKRHLLLHEAEASVKAKGANS